MNKYNQLVRYIYTWKLIHKIFRHVCVCVCVCVHTYMHALCVCIHVHVERGMNKVISPSYATKIVGSSCTASESLWMANVVLSSLFIGATDPAIQQYHMQSMLWQTVITAYLGGRMLQHS